MSDNLVTFILTVCACFLGSAAGVAISRLLFRVKKKIVVTVQVYWDAKPELLGERTEVEARLFPLIAEAIALKLEPIVVCELEDRGKINDKRL